MNSSGYSVAHLTEADASAIAEAYFKGDKDPVEMAKILGVSSFDLNIIMHPLVRKYIVQAQRDLNVMYSLKDHLEKLKEIRDSALDDDNYKVALQAETQVGKAAGLYEPKLPGEGGGDSDKIDPKKLSTDQLRRKVASLVGAVIPVEDEEPPLLEDSSQGEEDEQGLA